MNFKDEFGKQLDTLKPDGYIKDRVRRKMEIPGGKPSRRRGITVFRGAAAAVMCAAVVFSAGVLLSNQSKQASAAGIMKPADSYGEIYKAIEKYTKYARKINGINEVMLDGAAESANGTLKGSSANGNKSNTGTQEYVDQSSSAPAETEHSSTTTQVDGVDEADIVKTDGKYIYVLKFDVGEKVYVFKVENREPTSISEINLEFSASDMYLNGNRLAVIGNEDSEDGGCTSRADFFDVSSPENPKRVQTCTQSGYYNESRFINGRLFVISDYSISSPSAIKKQQAETYVPVVRCGNYDGAVKADTIHFYDNCAAITYTVLGCYEAESGKMVSTQSLLGGSYTVYASTENIITAGISGENGKTQIARFSVKDGNIEIKASAELAGTLLNQFSIDEYKGFYRFVVTDYRYEENRETSSNALYIFNEDLKQTGSVENVAPGERVYSVRFMGDVAYFVTFRQVDPLFSVDVSDPSAPKIIGSLKIPGFSNYLFPYGDGKLLGLGQSADENTGRATGVKLSVFDVSDPSNVTESAKTDVGAQYSSALYNHKAVLVDKEKNLIGFPVYAADGARYKVYSIENGGFTEKLNLKISLNGIEARGLYIGNTFYVVSSDSIMYFDIASFKRLGKTDIK